MMTMKEACVYVAQKRKAEAIHHRATVTQGLTKIIIMNTIKFINNKNIVLNGKKYKPYLVGDLPSTFGFIYDEDKDQDGITQWFNYKGLTYIKA